MQTNQRIALALLLAALWNQLRDGAPFAPSGPRLVAIVHESEAATPEVAELVARLRSGAAHEWLEQEGHRLLVVDKDARDETGDPPEWLARHAPYDVPEVLVLDVAGERLLHRARAPPGAEDVLKLLGK